MIEGCLGISCTQIKIQSSATCLSSVVQFLLKSRLLEQGKRFRMLTGSMEMILRTSMQTMMLLILTSVEMTVLERGGDDN